MQDTAKCEQESSKISEIRWLLVIQHKHDIRCTKGGTIRRFAIYLQPRRGRQYQAVVVEYEVGPSKDLLVSTFSLEAGDSTPAAAAVHVVEVEPSVDLAKPGSLNYLVEVDPLGDLTTSTDYRPEDEHDTVRLCAIIDTCKEYPTDPHLLSEYTCNT